MEKFKDIMNGRYTVSSYGRVFSNYRVNRVSTKKREKPLEMRVTTDRSGYQWLYLAGRKKILLHRLVLMTFVGDPPSPIHNCHHIDNNPRNNQLDNLQWVTPKENQNARIHHGTACVGIRGSTARLDMLDIEKVFALLRSGMMRKDIANLMKLDRGTISRLVNGHTYKDDARSAIEKWREGK